VILVDTSVWIDFLKGINSPERYILHRLIEEEEDISITEIIFTEVLQGIQEDERLSIRISNLQTKRYRDLSKSSPDLQRL
jgi:hypothetical protein